MYENLKKICLEDYLNIAFGNIKWHHVDWLVVLDKFIGRISKENLDILKKKNCDTSNHFQKNDVLNEIMIACAYYPGADFIKEDNIIQKPDLYDSYVNTYVEVKTLNVGDDEKKRYELMDKNNNVFTSVSTLLKEEEKFRKVNEIRFAVEKKCLEHFNKAASQLKGKGRIYLVYDYNLFHNLQHFNLFPKECVLQVITKCINDFLKYHTDIMIQAVYFADLREKINKDN